MVLSFPPGTLAIPRRSRLIAEVPWLNLVVYETHFKFQTLHSLMVDISTIPTQVHSLSLTKTPNKPLHKMHQDLPASRACVHVRGCPPGKARPRGCGPLQSAFFRNECNRPEVRRHYQENPGLASPPRTSVCPPPALFTFFCLSRRVPTFVVIAYLPYDPLRLFSPFFKEISRVRYSTFRGALPVHGLTRPVPSTTAPAASGTRSQPRAAAMSTTTNTRKRRLFSKPEDTVFCTGHEHVAANAAFVFGNS